MSDLIERQAAIDAVEFGITYAKAINKSTGEVKELFKEGNKALNDAVERIKDLPSAQSEPSQAARDIATILENEKDMRVIKKNAESESCADTISRKAAIDAMEQAKEQYFDRKVIIGKMQDIVNNLPSAQPNLQPTCNLASNDCISRQDAIDALVEWYGCEPNDIDAFKEIVEQLPSAQPETHEERTETHGVCLDAIDRQEAIDVLYKNHILGRGDLDEVLDHIVERLDKLPSAQPEQRLSCKNCIHLGHGYMMPCKNCKRNQMLPDWYEV